MIFEHLCRRTISQNAVDGQYAFKDSEVGQQLSRNFDEARIRIFAGKVTYFLQQPSRSSVPV